VGGNALKNTFTRRYQKEEFFDIELEIQEKLNTLGVHCRPIKAYSCKQSFGDLDILVLYDENINFMDVVKSFNPNEIFKNGKVISFDYKELQIDMIITKKEFYEFSSVYYSFNDIGNLMGRISHQLGMKYGHEGLTYTYRYENNNILGNVLLTQTPEKAFEILNYSYSRFLKGFNNLEEIFEYVISSKYFNKDIFNLYNRNHRARTRDKKRPTYTAFLKYCENNTFEHNYQFNKDKTVYHELIQSHFPHFLEEIKVLKEKEQKRKIIKDKFNGVLVNELTGLQGKELGAFMSSFRKEYLDDEIIEATQEEINLAINMSFDKKPTFYKVKLCSTLM